ncbi:hypothetical protein SAMN02799630_03622 [Paenibacillus sp. UNCCL117]|uniref:hypothetical protein n=1 Tax=unclassified Paenibacillus TaxID=185978 RepID=UPI0008899040|nr:MULTISPECIES: hypothetical protein [unclassified Paenibacillus]SDD52865.1 hypothetical protein SAMN04488602_109175 [Paenibacillus sp. cl123]SFW49225.1 hypothetical protein SAMN02799630_03622 [Paenibacillus sp. UNCCL117]
MNWNDWPLERLVYLFVGLAYLALGTHVTLSHYKKLFSYKSMWTPVAAAPVFSLTALWLAYLRSTPLLVLFSGLMWVGAGIGAAGLYFHVHGVGVRVGGYSMRNFLTGPPLVMPVLFGGISVIGLLAYYWR